MIVANPPSDGEQPTEDNMIENNSDDLCKISVCLYKAKENGYCEDHKEFYSKPSGDIKPSKLQRLLFERVNDKDVVNFCEGVNGLIAVTPAIVYLVRGSFLERKAIKSYAIKSITAIELRKPNMLTNGHFQIIASGVGDRTKRTSTAFDYARDENTVMIRSNYDHFVRLEQLIYEIRENYNKSQVATPTISEDNIFEKIEKLAILKDKQIITVEEFENKKKELLSKI